MALDQTANFIRGAVAASIASGDTTISVVDASLFPDPGNGNYNLVLWDADAYARPDQDPDVEVVRVTARDTTNDDLTVSRGQEATTAASHPSTSQLSLSPTAKMFADIDSQKLGDGEDFDGQGTSTFSNVKSFDTDDTDTTILNHEVTRTDVTPNRSFGTVYQNTTGKTMRVNLIAENSSGSAGQMEFNGYAGPSSNPAFRDQFKNTVDDTGLISIKLLVPDTHYYEYISFGVESIKSVFEVTYE